MKLDDCKAELDPTGIATDEEIKRAELSVMEALLTDCGNGVLRLSRILNRLEKAEAALPSDDALIDLMRRTAVELPISGGIKFLALDDIISVIRQHQSGEGKDV